MSTKQDLEDFDAAYREVLNCWCSTLLDEGRGIWHKMTEAERAEMSAAGSFRLPRLILGALADCPMLQREVLAESHKPDLKRLKKVALR